MSELTKSSACRAAVPHREARGPTVLKFGGTSVADVAGFARVTDILRAPSERRAVVVVSALAQVTDALLASAAVASDGDAARARQNLDGYLDRHDEIAQRLLTPSAAAMFQNELERARRAIAVLLQRVVSEPGARPALCDQIASYGERLSAPLLAAALAAAGFRTCHLDARRCIVTDETHGQATPIVRETERRIRAELVPLLENGLLPVLGGYIAASERGATTTLGRGGSDYTAALVGAALKAEEIQIWTDVNGVLTADPRVVPHARPIPRLSYGEAAELAYFGAKVLHPKTIEPAIARRIPIRICNTQAPEGPSTVVTPETDRWPGAVKVIAHKSGITLLQIVSSRMLGAHGFLHALFEVFDRHRTVVDVVTTSEVSVSLTLENTRSLPDITRQLEPLGEVSIEPHRAIVCLVGAGVCATPGVAARAFATLRDINVSQISHGASRSNLTFVVAEADVRDAVRRLHAAFLERDWAHASARAATGALA